MTAEQNRKIRWLERAREADRKAQALEAKWQYDACLAERLSRYSGCSGNSSGNSTEDALIRLIETERRAEEQLRKLAQIREEITFAIENVPDSDLQTILIWKYLKYMTFEHIADKMHYSLITIRRKHKDALDHIELV
ncbi:MAG: DUF1492 domain-containing protein [Oscillospiraceae bacterium]|nr:DUF1492 domain-containing protein [Oscillospiraceae bacterium]